MDVKQDYMVMDDTSNNIGFDELAAFEATIDAKTKAELDSKAAEILGIAKPAAA